MDPTMVAMILLSCNAQMQHCRVVEASPALYTSMAECKTALPLRLEETGMIGKCRPARGVASADGVVMVRVVRGTGEGARSTDYLVPRAQDKTR